MTPLRAFRYSLQSLVLFIAVAGILRTSAAPASEWIYPGKDGKLVYKTTAAGDKIMDFSSAGYMGGGVALPDVPVKQIVKPTGGEDDTAAIQAAYNLAGGVNDAANVADMGLGGVIGMAHAVPFMPNRWEKMGDPITQATTAAVIRDFEAAGFEVTEQVKFEKGALGIKDRYIDVYAKHSVTEEKFLIQIGEMTKSGIPKIRERWAWDDIIFSPTIGKPEYKGSKFLFIEKGATGLPPGWNQ
jgi:hypothetical protein